MNQQQVEDDEDDDGWEKQDDIETQITTE